MAETLGFFSSVADDPRTKTSQGVCQVPLAPLDSIWSPSWTALSHFVIKCLKSPSAAARCPPAQNCTVYSWHVSLFPATTMTSDICVFDAGTSGSGSLSLKFPALPGETRAAGDAGQPTTQLPQLRRTSEGSTATSALLPRHRSWSGGILFTLPEGSHNFDSRSS